MGFEKILNHENCKLILKAHLKKDHFPSYLFSGINGIGKRTCAIIFAAAINCPKSREGPCLECDSCRRIINLSHPDIKIVFPIRPLLPNLPVEKYLEEIYNELPNYRLFQKRPIVPANWSISIQPIRWLRSEMAYKPISARRKIIIILEADRMTQEAQNAFLKTLEEPQLATTIILTTPRKNSLFSTIISRCQTIRFGPMPQEIIYSYLKENCPISDAQASLAAEIAEGSIRKALNFLDDTEEFPSNDSLEIFDGRIKDDIQLLEFIEKYRDAPQDNLLNSLLLLYRSVLRVKSGGASGLAQKFLAIKKKSEELSLSEILFKIQLLLSALQDTKLYLNKRLFLFNLIKNLEFRNT